MPDRRVVAIRQRADQVLDAGEFGGRDEAIRIRCRGRIEARDVFGDRAGQQLDVLRHVAEMAPETVLVPMRQIVVADRDAAAARRPRADQGARQARFAGAARADNAEHAAFAEIEADIVQQRPVAAGAKANTRETASVPRELGQRYLGRLFLGVAQQVVEPPQRGEEVRIALPVRHHLIDRAEPAHHQGHGDERVRQRDFIVQEQQRSDREDSRHLVGAQKLGGGRKDFHAAARRRLPSQHPQMKRVPAVAQRRQHAQHADGVGVARHRLAELLRLDRKLLVATDIGLRQCDG